MARHREHPTPTGVWRGERLVPLEEALGSDLTVWLALEVGGEMGPIWEGLAARRTGPDRAVLRAVPIFAYDINYGDEIRVTASAEGRLVVTGLLQDAGQHTFRVFLAAGASTTLTTLIRSFGPLGCLIEGYSDRLLGLSCGATNAPAVTGHLAALASEGHVEWETGRQRRATST